MAKYSIPECLNEIIQASKDYPGNQNLYYAASYAHVAKGMAGSELRTQLLYIKSNLSYWRGALATDIKDSLKEHINA